MDNLSGLDGEWRRGHYGFDLGIPGADIGGQGLVCCKENAQHGIFDYGDFFLGARGGAVLYVLLFDYGGFGAFYGKGDGDFENRWCDCAGDDIWAGVSAELV